MSGSISSPTACTIDATGIHSLPFTDILSYLTGKVASIFGADTYLGNDSQDGQLLGIFAQAIYDTNSMAVAVYNSYSPATATGVGLSSTVKINGLARSLPSSSSVPLLIIGVAGTEIDNGQVTDQNNINWALPDLVTIPFVGQITVTATATIPGAVSAAAGTIIKIATPVFGWQSVINPTGATSGSPLESDPLLRTRQTNSTMIPSLSLLDGLTGAVLSLAGVTRVQAYENKTDIVDANTLPPHSISYVVEGGDATSIATTIALKKGAGANTYGNVTELIPDAYAIPHAISFFAVSYVTIFVNIHLTALNGYSTSIGLEIATAIAKYINALPIGSNVYLTKVIAAALNINASDALTFNMTSLALGTSGTPTPQDITILFNQSAQITVSNISIFIP